MIEQLALFDAAAENGSGGIERERFAADAGPVSSYTDEDLHTLLDGLAGAWSHRTRTNGALRARPCRCEPGRGLVYRESGALQCMSCGRWRQELWATT